MNKYEEYLISMRNKLIREGVSELAGVEARELPALLTNIDFINRIISVATSNNPKLQIFENPYQTYQDILYKYAADEYNAEHDRRIQKLYSDALNAVELELNEYRAGEGVSEGGVSMVITEQDKQEMIESSRVSGDSDVSDDDSEFLSVLSMMSQGAFATDSSDSDDDEEDFEDEAEEELEEEYDEPFEGGDIEYGYIGESEDFGDDDFEEEEYEEDDSYELEDDDEEEDWEDFGDDDFIEDEEEYDGDDYDDDDEEEWEDFGDDDFIEDEEDLEVEDSDDEDWEDDEEEWEDFGDDESDEDEPETSVSRTSSFGIKSTNFGSGRTFGSESSSFGISSSQSMFGSSGSSQNSFGGGVSKPPVKEPEKPKETLSDIAFDGMVELGKGIVNKVKRK